MSSDATEGRDYVRALARGLSVIESFEDGHAFQTVSDVARRTGLTRPSARRALLTLQTLGFVSADGDRFALTPRTLRLGYAYLSSEALWTQAHTPIREFNRRTGQTCSIAVLDGDETVFVARSAAKRIVNDYISIGLRWPAYPTSLGRVLLAGLAPEALDAYFKRVKPQKLTPHTVVDRAKLRSLIEQVRERGWASSDREMDVGLRSIGVPIRDARGRTIAAMNTNAPVHLMDIGALERQYLAELQETARAVSELVVWRPGPV